MRRIMVERSRIWRGPWRAPGRLVVPPSPGTPTMPISTSAGFRNSGRRLEGATAPKRGVPVPASGWGKVLGDESFMPLSSHSLRPQKTLAGRDKFLDRRHEAVTFGIADHDVERGEATPRDPDAGGVHVEEEQLLG